jgi:3-oxoacyl-[acyl-carrier protein] reductase
MDLQLGGRRALVLGSSGGLGRAIAETLTREGAKVAICSRDRERVEATAKEIGAAHAIALDLARPGAGKQVVEEARAALGGVDILVTNTGGPPKGNFLEVTLEQWQQQFQALWLSAVESIGAALPGMKEARFGRVLLVTSITSREPMPAMTLSNSLRVGLLGLTKSLSDEVASFGVTVNALLPGYTDTDRMRQLGVDASKVGGQIPARRLGKPEEFAAMAAFLASGLAGYVTGQAIAVDGGWLRSI